jgi:hypothetical protein
MLILKSNDEKMQFAQPNPPRKAKEETLQYLILKRVKHIGISHRSSQTSQSTHKPSNSHVCKTPPKHPSQTTQTRLQTIML